jgi:hypothetical protein
VTVTTGNSLPALEDFLGPAGQRFFGSGYRRVGQRLSDIVIERHADGRGDIRATAGVGYPADWSRKAAAKGDLRPHLSTIDALVFAAQLSELYLAGAHALGAPERSAMWLREVAIKAGTAPDEEGLAEFGVTAEARPSGPGETVLDCRIGAMRARCTVAHPAGNPVAGRLTHPSADGLLATDGIRPFGDGYRYRHTDVGELLVDLGSLDATGRAATRELPGASRVVDGLEAAYHPSVTMVDAFVIGLQLGQILLYELDGIPRAESETLWMRRTVLSATGPSRPSTGYPVRTSLRNTQLLDGRGARWRTADIVGDFAGVQLTCSVTHRLP